LAGSVSVDSGYLGYFLIRFVFATPIKSDDKLTPLF